MAEIEANEPDGISLIFDSLQAVAEQPLRQRLAELKAEVLELYSANNQEPPRIREILEYFNPNKKSPKIKRTEIARDPIFFERIRVVKKALGYPGNFHIEPEILRRPLEDLNLPIRYYNCLRRSNVTVIGQILRMDSKTLLSVRSFGAKSLDVVAGALVDSSIYPKTNVA